MAKGINFLSQYRKKIGKQQKTDLLIFRVAGVLGISIFVISLITFGTNIYLQYTLDQTQERQQQLEKAVLFQEDVEKSLVIVNRKLSIIGDLIDKRQNKQDTLDYFTGLFGFNVLIEEINYEAASAILSLRVRADSVFSFNNIIDRLESPETRERFSSLTKSELRRDGDGAYTVTITVALEETEEAAR